MNFGDEETRGRIVASKGADSTAHRQAEEPLLEAWNKKHLETCVKPFPGVIAFFARPTL